MSDLISRSELTEAIKRQYCTDCNNYDGVRCRACHADDMLALVDDMADAGPRWISVEERLPENYISVIGYLPIDDKEGLPPTREVYRTEKGWFAPSLGELCIVTHWMSMPEGFREV